MFSTGFNSLIGKKLSYSALSMWKKKVDQRLLTSDVVRTTLGQKNL